MKMSLSDQWLKHRGTLAAVGLFTGFFGGTVLATNSQPDVAAAGGLLAGGCFMYAATEKDGRRIAVPATIAAAAFAGAAMYNTTISENKMRQEAAIYAALPALPADKIALKDAYCINRDPGPYSLTVQSINYKFACP
jgi:hypothetical protein